MNIIDYELKAKESMDLYCEVQLFIFLITKKSYCIFLVDTNHFSMF